MALRLDQVQSFVAGYEKHPESGVKACEKKLKKDPQNTFYLVGLNPVASPKQELIFIDCTGSTTMEITPIFRRNRKLF
jgi:hypothetical protein